MFSLSDSEVRSEVSTLLSEVKGKYKRILWIGPPPRRKSEDKAQVEHLDRILKNCVEKR